MSATHQIATVRQPTHCSACFLIYPCDDNVQWYFWTIQGEQEVYCNACLGDPGQHWGEKLYLFRKASCGHGSPDSIHPLLDQIGLRPAAVEDSQEPRGDNSNTPGPRLGESSSLERYQYSALDSASNQIRVLYLYPGEKDSQILCSLEIIAFNRQYSDFTAMSYTWGNLESPKIDIYIANVDNGWTSFAVLQNLHQMLVNVRHPNMTRRLWIDAICINQSRITEEVIAESTAQLDLMGRIYRQASNVMIWLGLSTEEDYSYFVIDIIRQRSIDQMQSRKFWKGMGLFLQRPWFERTWIIQELSLSESSPQLLCGNRQISWSRFMATYSFLLFTRHLQPRAGSADYDPVVQSYIQDAPEVSNLHSLTAVRTQVKVDGGSLVERAIYGTLVRTRKFKATKPQDRVYGLRGLMPEQLLPQFPVNYNKPIEQVFKDAVQYMLKHEEGVQLFARFPLPLALGITHGLWPSWVPDFDSTELSLQNADGDANWYYRYPFRPFSFDISTRGNPHYPQGPKPPANAYIIGHKLITEGVSVDFISSFAESKIDSAVDYATMSKLDKIQMESDALSTQFQETLVFITSLQPAIEKAGKWLSSPDFFAARRAYLLELPLEQRARLVVREKMKKVQLQRFQMDSGNRHQYEEIRPDDSVNERAEGVNEEPPPVTSAHFDEVKEEIQSGPMTDEEKEACLSLVHSIEQNGEWKSLFTLLSKDETMTLRDQVDALAEKATLSGPEMMDFVNKYMDLTGQSLVNTDHLTITQIKSARSTSKMKEAILEMQKFIGSMIESLAGADGIYKALPTPHTTDHEWITHIWHSLLDGYDKLEDVSPEAFRQAFFDMVGSSSPPAASLGWNFETPRANEILARRVSRALRNVFHKGTQFFTCEKTGLYGLTTTAAKKGDMLVLLFPTWYMPMVVRRVEGSENYLMVGPAILPSARRIALLQKYEQYGLLRGVFREGKLSTFSFV